MEQCCGTTCDKELLEKQFKVLGVSEFLEFLEEVITEDVSAEAMQQYFRDYIQGLD